MFFLAGERTVSLLLFKMKKFWLLLICASVGVSSCLDKLAESPDTEEKDEVSETTSSDSGGRDPDSGADKKKEEKDDRTFTEIREERKALEKRVEELESLAASQNELIAEEVAVSARVEKIREYHSAVTQLRDELTAAKAGWQQASRDSFIGVQLPEVALTNGTTYSNVVISKVDGEMLHIKHTEGSAEIPILQLPVALRKNVLDEATVLATREGN